MGHRDTAGTGLDAISANCLQWLREDTRHPKSAASGHIGSYRSMHVASSRCSPHMPAVLDPHFSCVMVEATRLEDTTNRFATSRKRSCRRRGQMDQAQRVEKKLGNHLVFLRCHRIRHRFEGVGGLRRLDAGIWYVHAGTKRGSGVLRLT